MADAILVLNAGSSSLKFSLFEIDTGAPLLVERGQLEGLTTATHFEATASDGTPLAERSWYRALIPLAPLHQPHNLAPIHALLAHSPRLPQVACFDTAFHRTLPDVEQAFALPPAITARGVRRYGFHGLSYENIASALPAVDPEAARGRTVVAHLGNGIDALVFTGGIGEHAAPVRGRVVAAADWRGLTLDREANARDGATHLGARTGAGVGDTDERGTDDRAADAGAARSVAAAAGGRMMRRMRP